tara:strand:- start:13 stop:348 length:336 start_codon:yes stop_codon:yes gene_type:complete
MEQHPNLEQINQVSNTETVFRQLDKYYDKSLYLSTQKNKKYMIEHNGKFIHFGDINHSDYTKHNDKVRRLNYLKRATKIKGDWASSAVSPNMLSIILLWDGYKYLIENGII